MQLDGVRALVIESDETSRTILSSRARKIGCTVEACDPHTEDLKKIAGGSFFDIVLVGIHSRGEVEAGEIEGLGTITCIREHSHKRVRALPVIALSMNRSIFVKRATIHAGADLFIDRMTPEKILYLEVLSMTRMRARLQSS